MKLDNLQKTLPLFLIFIFLLTLAMGLKTNFFKANKKASSLLSFDKDVVENIELASQDSSIYLQKESDIWIISDESESTSAAKEKVEAFLQTIGRLDDSKLASVNKDKEASFALDSESAKTITINGGASQWKLSVGENTPDFLGNYVRLPDSDSVYASSDPLSQYFSIDYFK